MRKGNLTREQVIKIVGKKLVEELEKENCDFTNRLQTDGDESVEFSASIKFIDNEGSPRWLTVYYYQNPEDLEECDDLGCLNWEIEGYEIY
jgi:hypothetical protein